jgi:copper resistance protein B
MIRLVSALAATSVLALAAPVAAQEMKGMNMSGMAMPMPAKKAPAKTSATKKVAPSRRPAVGRSAGHQTAHGSTTPEVPMPGMDMPGGHAGQDTASMPGVAQTGTALAPGNAPAPAPPMDHYADRMFSPIEMTRARSAMMHESGGQTTYQVMFNLAEFQAHEGHNGYRWDGQAWIGGDINRLWLKSEGEGAFREGVDGAEVQALYSRAVGPYFNLQGGVRHDFRPSPTRNYATIGFEGLAPYMFEVEGALFLSTRGELLGRLEGYYDQRITQRLILQPRVEFNLSAQDVPENRIGAGLTDAELGLRLRYEITRQFAPYIGVSYLAQAGRTADFTRARGKDPQTTSFVAGVRFWF